MDNGRIISTFNKESDENKSRLISTFNKTEKIDNILNDINQYVSQICSGKEFGDECDMGVLCSKGECIISFDDLKNMIKSGNYNIISAVCYNPKMIEVKFEKYDKNLSMFR